jgi:hypothetical protein
MLNGLEIKWRKDESLKAIVAATFPTYRKTKVVVRASEAVTLYDLNWSGGTRNEYKACTVAGEAAGSTAKYNACHPWSNPAEGQRMPIPKGMLVVEGGYFCGRERTLTLHVNPADMPKSLSAPGGAS